VETRRGNLRDPRIARWPRLYHERVAPPFKWGHTGGDSRMCVRFGRPLFVLHGIATEVVVDCGAIGTSAGEAGIAGQNFEGAG